MGIAADGMASEHGVVHVKVGAFYLFEDGVCIVDILHRDSGEKLAQWKLELVEASLEHQTVNLSSLTDLIA